MNAGEEFFEDDWDRLQSRSLQSRLQEIAVLLDLKYLREENAMIGALLESNSCDQMEQRLEFRKTGALAIEERKLPIEVFLDFGALLSNPVVIRWINREKEQELAEFLVGALLTFESYVPHNLDLESRIYKKGRLGMYAPILEMTKLLSVSSTVAFKKLESILNIRGWSSRQVGESTLLVANWAEGEQDQSPSIVLTASIQAQGLDSSLLELGFDYQNMTWSDCNEKAKGIIDYLVLM